MGDAVFLKTVIRAVISPPITPIIIRPRPSAPSPHVYVAVIRRIQSKKRDLLAVPPSVMLFSEEFTSANVFLFNAGFAVRMM
jgi:hypothetical protein